MKHNQAETLFRQAAIPTAVLQNAVPAMLAMLMVLIYNLADTFFIGQTHDALQVAAVSLATPVFLMFMSIGSVFGIGGTSVIIVVGVALETVKQMEAQMLMRHYKGFLE